MAKGYWIAGVDVTDPEGYKEYVAANAAAFQQIRRALHRARRTLRGSGRHAAFTQRCAGVQGLRNRPGLLPIRPEYAAAKAMREGRAEANLIIIEGYDG